MRASSRRSHHSSGAPPGVNWPRITKPSPSRASSAPSIATGANASRLASAPLLVGPLACRRPRSSSRSASAGCHCRLAYSAGIRSGGDAVPDPYSARIIGHCSAATQKRRSPVLNWVARPCPTRLANAASSSPAAKFSGVHHTQQHQRIVQFIGALGRRAGFVAHRLDGRRIELTKLRGTLRIEPTPGRHRLGTPPSSSAGASSR